MAIKIWIVSLGLKAINTFLSVVRKKSDMTDLLINIAHISLILLIVLIHKKKPLDIAEDFVSSVLATLFLIGEVLVNNLFQNR